MSKPRTALTREERQRLISNWQAIIEGKPVPEDPQRLAARQNAEDVWRLQPEAMVAWDRDLADQGWHPIFTVRRARRLNGARALHAIDVRCGRPWTSATTCHCHYWDGTAWQQHEHEDALLPPMLRHRQQYEYATIQMSSHSPIAVNVSTTITIRPHLYAFRPIRMFVTEAENWTINDIKVGNLSQFPQGGDIPGHIFALDNVGQFPMNFQTVQLAQDFSIAATNVGPRDAQLLVAIVAAQAR